MPCDDVTESLRLVVDDGDCLVGYQLIKRTCGRAVGEQSLLAEEFAGRAAEDLINLDIDTFADTHQTEDETLMFLQLKHVFAVKAGLNALLGRTRAGAADPVRVAKVIYEGSEVVLEADISVDVITEEIEACGKCKGCGALAAAKKALAT